MRERPLPIVGASRHVLRLVGALLVLTIGVAGCDAGPSSDGADTENTRDPATAPSEALTPQPPPTGWKAVEGIPIALYVPPSFQARQRPAGAAEAAGSTGVLLLGPPDAAGRTPGVTATYVENPTRPISTEVDAHQNLQGATQGVDEFDRTEIQWPGAKAAVLLSYESTSQDSDGLTTDYTSEWLFADLDDGSQVYIGAVAPTEEFESLQVRRVLTSVELTG